MKNHILALTFMVATAGANAGVAEKKAMRAADQKIADQVAALKLSCGNAKLDVAVDWDKVDAMITANAALIESKSTKVEWVYAEVGNRTSATLEALGSICKADADYKEEIAKLSKVVVAPKPKYDDYKSEFKLESTTLSIDSGWYMSREASDFEERLKALY